MGIRTSKTVTIGPDASAPTAAHTATYYVVDKNRDYAQVLAEWTAQWTGQTAPGPQTDALAVTYRYGHDLIHQTRDPLTTPVTHYFHYDGQLSTRHLTDSPADPLTNPPQVTDSYTYGAYGELLSPPGPTTNNYLYAGEQLDPDLGAANTPDTGNPAGFYYLRARYYSPGQGRFTGRDPFGGLQQDPSTLHKYLYAGADPANNIDPGGLFFGGPLGMLITGTLISGIIGAALGGIINGKQGAIEGLCEGLKYGFVITAAVLGGGLGIAALTGLSVGWGIFMSQTIASILFAAIGINNVMNASSPGEEFAAYIGLVLIAVSLLMGARFMARNAQGRGTYVDRSGGKASPHEVAFGKWLARKFGLDVESPPRVETPGVKNPDYRISFSGRTIELANVGSMTVRNLGNRIAQEATQAPEVLIILNKAAWSMDALAEAAAQAFRNTSKLKSVGFFFKVGSSYEAGPSFVR